MLSYWPTPQCLKAEITGKLVHDSEAVSFRFVYAEDIGDDHRLRRLQDLVGGT